MWLSPVFGQGFQFDNTFRSVEITTLEIIEISWALFPSESSPPCLSSCTLWQLLLSVAT